MGDNSMKLEIPAQGPNVALARLAVAAFAAGLDFTLPEIEEIKVAVSEAVTNVVLHAYGAAGGTITITAAIDAGRLLVTVADAGRGIADVKRARQPGQSTCPGRTGLGFSFMESLMDEVAVDAAPGRGTTVRMVKRPAPGTGAPPDTAPGSGVPPG